MYLHVSSFKMRPLSRVIIIRLHNRKQRCTLTATGSRQKEFFFVSQDMPCILGTERFFCELVYATHIMHVLAA